MWRNRFSQFKGNRTKRIAAAAPIAVVILLLSGGLPLAGAQDTGPVEHVAAEAQLVACKEAVGPALGEQCISVRESWVTVENGLAGGSDGANAMVLSPDGSTAYLTGHKQSVNEEEAFWGFFVAAYDTQTGERQWQTFVDEAGTGYGITVSADGTTLFAAGTGFSPDGYIVAALGAATGEITWKTSETASEMGLDLISPDDVLLSPSGSSVLVSGDARPAGDRYTMNAMSFDASTGDRNWIHTLTPGSLNEGDLYHRGTAFSPDGAKVILSGADYCGSTCDYPWVVIQLDMATGDLDWRTDIDYPDSGQVKSALVVTDDNVFLASRGWLIKGVGALVAALDSATGDEVWIHEFAETTEDAEGLVLSADGSILFVSGSGNDQPFAAALDPDTGDEIWFTQQSSGGFGDQAYTEIALNPEKGHVYISGQSGTYENRPYNYYDFTTLAFDTGTGDHLWTVRYNGDADSGDYVEAIAVHPDGEQLFVAGMSTTETGGRDVALVAYDLDVWWQVTDLVPDS